MFWCSRVRFLLTVDADIWFQFATHGGGSYAFHAIGNFHIPVEVSMDVLVSFSSSSGSEAVSSLLTELNDDSGIFLVIPIGLFILRATGSLFLVVCWW